MRRSWCIAGDDYHTSVINTVNKIASIIHSCGLAEKLVSLIRTVSFIDNGIEVATNWVITWRWHWARSHSGQ